MGARSNIADNDLLKIPAWNARVIEEHIILLAGQILIDRQRPGDILAAVTDENGFLNARHNLLTSWANYTPNNF